MYKQFGQCIVEDDGIRAENKELLTFLSSHIGEKYDKLCHLFEVGPTNIDGDAIPTVIANAISDKLIKFDKRDHNYQQQLRNYICSWCQKDVPNESTAFNIFKTYHPDGNLGTMRAHMVSKTAVAGREWGKFELELCTEVLGVTIVELTFEDYGMAFHNFKSSPTDKSKPDVVVYFAHHTKRKMLDFDSANNIHTHMELVVEPDEDKYRTAFDYDAYIKACIWQEDFEKGKSKMRSNVGEAVLRALRDTRTNIDEHTSLFLKEDKDEARALNKVLHFAFKDASASQGGELKQEGSKKRKNVK